MLSSAFFSLGTESFFTIFFSGIIVLVSNGWDPNQVRHNVGPDLSLNRLQRCCTKRLYCSMLKIDCCVAGWLLSHSDVCGVGGADFYEIMS